MIPNLRPSLPFASLSLSLSLSMSVPAARRVDDGAGGRLLYPLFWHIVVAL